MSLLCNLREAMRFPTSWNGKGLWWDLPKTVRANGPCHITSIQPHRSLVQTTWISLVQVFMLALQAQGPPHSRLKCLYSRRFSLDFWDTQCQCPRAAVCSAAIIGPLTRFLTFGSCMYTTSVPVAQAEHSPENHSPRERFTPVNHMGIWWRW